MKTLVKRLLQMATYFFLLHFLMTGYSCADKPKDNVATDEAEQVQDTILQKATDTTAVLSLEDIPFQLPEKWTYLANPVQGIPAFSGIASDPSKGNVSVTVWDYPTQHLDSMIHLFRTDMRSLGYEINLLYTDTLIHGLSITPETKFKWIGKHFMRNDKMRLIAVGAVETDYAYYEKEVARIYNTITED